MNYYNTLGLSENANQSEIKKAYRKLAREYHPDVNNSKSAVDKFKEMTLAYKTLSDSRLKDEYDKRLDVLRKNSARTYRSYKEQAQTYRKKNNSDNQQNHNFYQYYQNIDKNSHLANLKALTTTISKKSFGFVDKIKGLASKVVSEKNEKLESVSVTNVQVSTTEAITGSSKTIKVENNSGTRNIKVNIPAGVRTGTIIRMRSKTPPLEELLIAIVVMEHKNIKIGSRGITLELPITVKEAYYGTQFKIKLWDNRQVSIKIPVNTQSGQEICYPGTGILNPHDIKNDLYIKFLIVLPDATNSNPVNKGKGANPSISGAIELIDYFYRGNPRKAIF